MGVIIIDTLQRGGSGTSPFPVILEKDSRISYVTVANITARDAIEEWRRLSNMQCYVISEGKSYRLGTDLTIAGQVWTEIPGVGSGFELLANKGQPDGYVPLNSDTKIDPVYIDNIYSNKSWIVASEAEMLALASLTGDIITRTDTSQIFVKLNNTTPSQVADHAELLFPGSVLSVNGQTGAVSITITNLLAWQSNQTEFDAAVTANSTVAGNSAAITVNQQDIAQLQLDVAALQAQANTAIRDFDANEANGYTADQDYVVYPNADSGTLELYKCIQSSVAPHPLPTDTNTWSRVGDYYTTKETDDKLVLKADLVGGVIPLNQLPPQAFAGTIVVPDIASRNAYTPVSTGMEFYVEDASADPLVSTGPAEYIYSPLSASADADGFVLKSVPGPQAANYSWNWGDAVDGGTYLDFVITGALDYEIDSLETCLLWVGKALQTYNFSIQTTNVINDTIRLQASALDRPDNPEVFLAYNRAGIGVPSGTVSKGDIAFTVSVPFDKLITRMAEHTISTPTDFTPNTVSAELGNTTYCRVIADGVNEPTFSGFEGFLDGIPYSNNNGDLNLLFFWYDGDEYWYGIKRPLANLNAPVLSALTGVTSTKIRATWTDPNSDPSESSVQAIISDDAGFSNIIESTNLPAGTTTYDFDSLTANTQYWVKIIAKGNGTETKDSPDSNTETFITINIILATDFPSTTIDTVNFDIINPDAQIVPSQNNAAIWTVNLPTVADFRANRWQSKATFDRGAIQAIFSGTNDGAYSNSAFGFFNSDSPWNGVLIFISSGNNTFIRRYVAGVTTSVDLGLAFLNVEWKLVYEANDDIRLFYSTDHANWVEYVTGWNNDLGTGFKVLYSANSKAGTSGQTQLMNDLFVTNGNYLEIAP